MLFWLFELSLLRGRYIWFETYSQFSKEKIEQPEVWGEYRT